MNLSFSEFVKRIVVFFLILLLVSGIWAARSTLLLGFAAATIAVGISIPADWLQQRGMKRGWAIALSTAGMLILAVFLLLLVLPRLLNDGLLLLGSIPRALRVLTDLYTQVRGSSEFLSLALSPLSDTDLTAGGLTTEQAQAIFNQLISSSLAIAPTLLGGVSTLIATLLNLVFVLFIAIFFLVEPKTYVKATLYLIPERHHTHAINIWNELYHTIRTWISALSSSIAITVTLVWVLLGVLLGMPNALVVAVFAGIATFIPNIGAFLPLIPILIFSLASNDPERVFLYIPAYLAIQFAESNIITPSIVKAELEIPPGALMLFQLLATLAFGALGLLLAVPILAVLIVLVRELYSYETLGLRQRAITLVREADGRIGLVKTTKKIAVRPEASNET